MMLALAIEGLLMLGDNSSAGELYPLAREMVDTGAVALWQISRFTHTVAGMAAAAARQWEAAEHHFQTALHQAEDVVPFGLEQAEIRRFRAMMLLNRGNADDSERAAALLHQAREVYDRIGMRSHGEITQTLLAQARNGSEL